MAANTDTNKKYTKALLVAGKIDLEVNSEERSTCVPVLSTEHMKKITI
jgi:hypothetical protein